MRGAFVDQGGLFSYIAPEARVPANHPLRKIRELVRDVLGELNRSLGRLYANEGRPSIPPEQLLSALLLQVFYGIRSERQLMEQLNYNLGVGLAQEFPPQGRQRRRRRRSQLPRPAAQERHACQHQAILTAVFTARPPGGEAQLCYMGHATMENRHGLAVAGIVTLADGTAERRASEIMLKAKAKKAGRRITVGEDKAYDTADHVANLRALNVTPHVVQNDSITATGKRRQSAIDGRTTRHKGYGLSQSCRAMTRMHLRLGQKARHDAQNKTSRHNQGRYRFHAQSNVRVPGEIISKLWLTKRGFTVRGQWVGAAPGVRAAESRRQPLLGVGMALSGQTAPYSALRHRPKTRMSTCDSPTVGH